MGWRHSRIAAECAGRDLRPAGDAGRARIPHDRSRATRGIGGARRRDEQLLVAEDGDTLSMALYIDASVLERLDAKRSLPASRTRTSPTT